MSWRAGGEHAFGVGQGVYQLKKLVKYNDLHKEYTLEAGDIIYLKEKAQKAADRYRLHSERRWFRAYHFQKYGIRLKNPYKMNRKMRNTCRRSWRQIEIKTKKLEMWCPKTDNFFIFRLTQGLHDSGMVIIY